jgi:hypothetical protein
MPDNNSVDNYTDNNTQFYKSLKTYKIFTIIFMVVTAAMLGGLIYWIIYYYAVCETPFTCLNSCSCGPAGLEEKI